MLDAVHTHCSTCGARRARKGQHPTAFRTAFGKLSLPSPRYYQCCGTPISAKSVSPLANLLAERTAPELVHLASKFAGLMSYGLTVSVLSAVLPLGTAISTTDVRRQVHSVAQRRESELGEERLSFIDTCQLDPDKLPEPGPPLTVGLDGGFVHTRDENRRQAGSFERGHGGQKRRRGWRSEMLCIRKQRRREAEAQAVRSPEITGAAAESAADVPVGWRRNCS
jgi:hypothetical protein